MTPLPGVIFMAGIAPAQERGIKNEFERKNRQA